jgi:hypothetical protein
MPDSKPPAVGEEVPASLVPDVGEDVSHLMEAPATEHPVGSSTSLKLAAAEKLLPVAKGMALELAQNPQVPYAAAKVGRVAGGLAPVVGGAAAGGLPGALMGTAAAAKGSWAGGHTGWFTGKLLQNVSGSAADALTAVEPVLQKVANIIGPQALLDLMQTAEPNRHDIGFLGMGTSQPDATLKQPAAQLAAVEMLVKQGKSPSEAIKSVLGDNPKLFGPLMTLYMRSKSSK